MDREGMSKDDIWFECSVCGKKIYPDSKCMTEGDFIYCEECYNNLPEPDIKED